jgi:hypothetical protein
VRATGEPGEGQRWRRGPPIGDGDNRGPAYGDGEIIHASVLVGVGLGQAPPGDSEHREQPEAARLGASRAAGAAAVSPVAVPSAVMPSSALPCRRPAVAAGVAVGRLALGRRRRPAVQAAGGRRFVGHPDAQRRAGRPPPCRLAAAGRSTTAPLSHRCQKPGLTYIMMHSHGGTHGAELGKVVTKVKTMFQTR